MTTACELTADRLGTRTVMGLTYDRFLTPVAERLEETGHWRILRRNGSYCLCLPDNGSVPKLKAKIPEPDELLKLAGEIHERGEPWQGTAFGWPARFTPSRMGRIISAPSWQRKDDSFGPCRPARLEVGITGLWRAVVEWSDRTPEVWVED